jgi:hypothetical protein
MSPAPRQQSYSTSATPHAAWGRRCVVAWRRGIAQNLPLLPQACQSSRLRFHSQRRRGCMNKSPALQRRRACAFPVGRSLYDALLVRGVVGHTPCASAASRSDTSALAANFVPTLGSSRARHREIGRRGTSAVGRTTQARCIVTANPRYGRGAAYCTRTPLYSTTMPRGFFWSSTQ